MPDPNELADMLMRVPELRKSPTLAAAAYMAPTDTLGTGQALAHVADQKAQHEAVEEVSKHHGGRGVLGKSLGFLGDVVSPILKPLGESVGGALHVAGAGLREVQHQYRYLHDVEARHGPLAVLLQGAAMTAGAVGGTLLAGPVGGVLGAELAGGIADRGVDAITHQDSWERTANGEAYRDPSGHKVSIGRDLAGIINLKPGSKPFTVISGASDFIADLTLDPLAKAGKLAAEAKSAEGMRGAAHAWKGGIALRPDNIDQALAQNANVRRAFADIASKSAGEIAADYPKLSGAFKQLGEAKDVTAVANVFKDSAEAFEVTNGLLPTRGRVVTPLRQFSNRIQSWQGIGAEEILDKGGNVMLDDLTGKPLMTLGKGARQIKALTAKLPESWNAEIKGFSNKDFALGDDHAVRGVYMSMRLGGMTKRAAEAAATEFANAEPANQLIIWRGAMMKSLLQAGLPEDASIVLQMKQELVDASGGAFAGKTAKFGYDHAGNDLSSMLLADGSHTSAALTLSQEGRLSFPNYHAIKASIREMHSVSNLFGAADDWVYTHYTGNIFKRMVLLSGGFAGRVAAGELIPRGMAEGFHNIAKNAIAANRALLDDVDPAEIGHITKTVGFLLKGVQKVARVSDEDVELGTDLIRLTKGHIVDHNLQAGHDYSDEVMSLREKHTRNLYKATQEVPEFQRGAFRGFGPGENQQPLAWHEWLTEQAQDPMHKLAAQEYRTALARGADEADATIQARQAVTDWLDGITGGTIKDKAIDPRRLKNYIRHEVSGDPNLRPHEDWAKNIVENMKGATHSAEGARHDALLEKLANGEAMGMDDLAKIAQNERPALVKAQELQPQFGQGNMLERIADVGFKRVLNPIINKLAREPLYFTEFKKQMGLLEAMPGMNRADALSLAQSRATATMTRYVHNINERTQFAENMRNFMPFFFAQQQAWARAGRLLAENPGAFRQYQLATSMLHEVGHVTTDADGQQHVVYPGVGFLGKAMPAVFDKLGLPMAGSIPIGVSGNLRSLSSVFPLAEQELSFGPVVSLPLNGLRSLFPEMTPVVQGILGEQGANADVISQLIMPNATIRRSYEALTKGESNRSFANAEIAIIQGLSFKQEQAMEKYRKSNPEPPQTDVAAYEKWEASAPDIVPSAKSGPVKQQEFLDQVRNQTRVLMMTKAMIGSVAPMAPSLNIGEVGLQDDLQKLIDEKGYADGTAEFLRLNPDATPYTVSKSHSNTNSPLQADSASGKFMEEHRGLFESHPYAAAWFIPQSDGAFEGAVYNEQLAMALRVRKSPGQVMKDIYTAIGDRQYFDEDKPAYDKAVAEATAAGDHLKLQEIKTQWRAYKVQFQKQNPIWAENIQSGKRPIERKQAVAQMRDLFDKNLAPPGQQTEELKGLLKDWDDYNALRPPGGTTRAEKARKSMDVRWEAYLKQTQKEKPILAPVIRKIFLAIDPEPLEA